MKHRQLQSLLVLAMILGSWKGYIALFEEGETEPCQFFPKQVSSLPVLDQQALEEGILIRNDKKLQQLLEDYLS